MAVYTHKTLATMRAEVRRELLDVNVIGTATGRWWTDAELNGYLDDAQDSIQQRYELVWGTATATITAGTGTATVTLSDVASDMLRAGVLFWNGARLPFTTEWAMDAAKPDWRADSAANTPALAYHTRLGAIGLWPALATTASAGTLVALYPVEPTWTTDTATHVVPSYCRPAMVSYAAWRAYLRNGPNQDRNKAERYRQLWEAQLRGIGSTRAAYWPAASKQLRPATQRELELIDPAKYGMDRLVVGGVAPVVTMAPTFNLYNFVDEVPTGTANGTNTTYVLSTAPNPATSLEFEIDGVTLASASYTLTSNTVTTAFAVPNGSTLFARYRVVI